MEMAPRLAIWPGLCLTIVVYSINMSATHCATCSTPGCAAASAESDHEVHLHLLD